MLAEHYTIDDVQPVDLFPHTHHVENVIKLRRH
jgi:23S rRNA (uracil1939-C5)-methyltransferase